MNIKEVCQEVKKRFNGICRICRECNGVICASEFPGIAGVCEIGGEVLWA